MAMYLIARNFASNTLIFYFAATEKDTKGDKVKTFIFLTCIGQKGRELYETFTFEPADEMKLAPVLHKFSEYCNPKENIAVLCHKFFTYRQQEGQNFHDFMTELKKLSSTVNLVTSRIHW